MIFDPPLTTMRQPREEIGRLAALELLRRLRESAESKAPRKVRMECELIIRASTQALRVSIEQKKRDPRPADPPRARAARDATNVVG